MMWAIKFEDKCKIYGNLIYQYRIFLFNIGIGPQNPKPLSQQAVIHKKKYNLCFFVRQKNPLQVYHPLGPTVLTEGPSPLVLFNQTEPCVPVLNQSNS